MPPHPILAAGARLVYRAGRDPEAAGGVVEIDQSEGGGEKSYPIFGQTVVTLQNGSGNFLHPVMQDQELYLIDWVG